MSDINALVFESTPSDAAIGAMRRLSTPKEVLAGEDKGQEIGSKVGHAVGGAVGHLVKFSKEHPEIAAAAGGGLAAAYLTRNHIRNRG